MEHETLSSALLQIRHDSKSCISENDILKLLKKYDIAFGGYNANSIYSIELVHALDIVFNLKISHDELMQQLPTVCKELGMHLEPMTDSNPSDTRSVTAYRIDLY